MDILKLLCLCILLFSAFLLAVFKGRIWRRLYVDKIKGEPIRSEDALVHAKSDHSWPLERYDSFYVIHFYIADRNTVVHCEVPEKIWLQLEKGQRGELCHQGGEFHSFQTEDHLYRDIYVTGY